MYRLYKRMNGSGKWRCISKVCIFKIFQNSTHIQPHNGNIHHLVYCTGSQNLYPQQFMCLFFCNQFGSKEACSRIIVCLVICRYQNRYNLISCCLCLLLCKTCASHMQTRKFYDTGSQYTGISFPCSGQYLRQGSAFHICGRAHWSGHFSASNHLFCFCTCKNTDTLFQQMFFHISSHFLIQNIGKKLGSKIQDRNLHAFVLQIFCCFQPYKSSSDNNGLLHLVFFHIRTNSRCIIRGTHFKYTLLCHTWNEQFCRRCSYSQNQLVISTDFFFSCKQILYCHLLFIRASVFSFQFGCCLGSCSNASYN